MHICTSEEMREIESSVDASGHSYDDMMRLAGAAVADAVSGHASRGARVVVLCGPGNNGGDGLVAAADLALAGFDVKAFLWRREPDDIPAPVDVEGYREVAIARDVDADGLGTLDEWLAEADVVVDGLLGTGGGRAIESPLSDILAAAASAAERSDGPHVVAVDAPTGLNLTDGTVDPAILAADVTVTFGFPKVGQLRFPGAAYVGDLVVDDIGMSPEFATGDLHMATAAEVAATLPERPLDGHKGTFGKALVVAGSVNYTGAAYLAAGAAYRVGGGLVTAAVPASIHGVIAGLVPEATFLVVPEDLGVVARGAAELVCEAMADYDAVLVGPGLTDQRPVEEFFIELLEHGQEPLRPHETAIGFGALRGQLEGGPSARAERAGSGEASASGGGAGDAGDATGDEPADKPAQPRMVIDADGLNILAKLADRREQDSATEVPLTGRSSAGLGSDEPAPADAVDGLGMLRPETVLTPHPGEMARLTGRTAEEVNADRVATARDAAAEWGHIVVLKGALTVVAAPDGRATVIPFANPALAVAGTGDVLSGAIVGLLAQGAAPFDAAVAGAYLHAVAGDMAGEAMGARGTTAGDVLRQLAWALAEVEGGEDQVTAC